MITVTDFENVWCKTEYADARLNVNPGQHCCPKPGIAVNELG